MLVYQRRLYYNNPKCAKLSFLCPKKGESVFALISKGENDMSFIEGIKARAKQNLKTIVLPETEDRRVMEAAAITLKEGTANIVLVGSDEEIEKTA